MENSDSPSILEPSIISALQAQWRLLRMCWSLPGADATTQSLLLNQQLEVTFRVIPVYVVAILVTATGLMLSIAPLLPFMPVFAWSIAFLVAHTGWFSFAWQRSYGKRTQDHHSLTIRDLYLNSMWCASAALTMGAGLYLCTPLLKGAGQFVLVACYVTGTIATGVLVGITTPLASSVWLIVLTVSACLTSIRTNVLLHAMTVALLLVYDCMLSYAMLMASRMFVARVEAELGAERERQVVKLLLGDFEQGASDWLWETDARGIISRANRRLDAAAGVGSALGAELASLFESKRMITVPSDRDVGVEKLRELLASDKPFRGLIVETKSQGSVRSWSLSAKPLYDSNGLRRGWRGVGNDVTQARGREAESIARERRLHHMATHDALTALPNRRAFFEEMETWQTEPTRKIDGARHAVVIIDLDNFKAVNDALGHGAGDTVLQHVALRLKQTIEPGDFIARLGGDEFAMIIKLPSLESIDIALEKRSMLIVERLRSPEKVGHFQLDVRASIGVTLVERMEKPSESMRKADIALYAAKKAGRDNYKIYAEHMSLGVKRRLSMVSDLALSVQRRELEVFYQCIVDLTNMRVIGFEALLRWQHPTYGLILPCDFIPAAEESGLIIPIGLWVFQQACIEAATWPDDVILAVNVSSLQLDSPTIVSSILDCIDKTGLAPQRIELEITESSLIRENKIARNVLHQLREVGLRVALDDFGTGYSSMSQLRELPVDKLKIDRSFVSGLDMDGMESSSAIIDSMLHLCRLMNLSSTAEGVETRLELAALRRLGCQSAQGYLFSRPVAKSDVAAVISANHRRHIE